MYLPILTYHRLLSCDPTKSADPMRISVSQAQFRRHLLWLKRLGYRSCTLGSYVQRLRQGGNVPPRTLAITFDDGYEEVLTLGLPVLREFGFTAAVFAVSAEERNRWDDGNARLLSAAQLRQWREAGMEVGAHGCTHAHLTRIGGEDARREIRDSKVSLEQVLGQAVNSPRLMPTEKAIPGSRSWRAEAGFRKPPSL